MLQINRIEPLENGVLLILDVDGETKRSGYKNRECALFDYGQKCWHYIIKNLNTIILKGKIEKSEELILEELKTPELIQFISENKKTISGEIKGIESLEKCFTNVLFSCSELERVYKKHPLLL